MTPDHVSTAAGIKRRRTYKPALDLANPPPRVDRRTAAALLYARFGVRVSPRTTEGWTLPTKRVNGYATLDTEDVLARGRAMVDAAPPIRGGKRAADLQSAA